MASNLWRRLAKNSVRLYPRKWRERYEDEVEALLDATAPGPGVAIDLTIGAIRERSGVLGAVVWFAAVVIGALAQVMVIWATLAVLFVLIVGPLESVRFGFDWSEWAARRIFDVPYAVTAGLPMWFFFSMQFSLPILLLLLWPPIRRGQPVLARVIFITAFCGFSLWLGNLPQQLAMLFCSWLIAVKVFPTGAAARAKRSSAPKDMMAAGSESDRPSVSRMQRITVAP